MTIKLTYADYSRIMPLAAGQVDLQGLDIELVLSRHGSWVGRAEMLRRALTDPSVQGGEASMGIHLRRMDHGDRSFVALPIFSLRNFTARDLYVAQGSTLRGAADLAGKRIGMYSWTASGSVWYRHFLRHHGADPDGIKWVIGETDKDAYAARTEGTMPAHVTQAPAGKSLSDLLLEGAIDVIYSPPRPARYHPTKGPIARLYPDHRTVELDYFKATGVFPPQHLVVLRRDVWEADRSLARRITDAFIRCEAEFCASQNGFPYATPWLDSELEAAEAAMGANPYAHGIEENRQTMELFAEEAFKLGLTSKRIAIDDYFREYLAS